MNNFFLNPTVEEARYESQVISAFRGNPFIEALPPILARDEAKSKMAYYPDWDPSIRTHSKEVRVIEAGGISSIRHPVGIHADLESRISSLIRWGYASRNPVAREFQRELDTREASLSISGSQKDLHVGQKRGSTLPKTAAKGLTFLGITGIGKTAAMEMVLSLYPQVIFHREYQGNPFMQTQLVWLTLQCPPAEGSILTLASNFFEAIDELLSPIIPDINFKNSHFGSRPTIYKLIPAMARVAAQVGLGALIIDEVQDLKPRGADAILSFLVQLTNTIGIPVILIGGFDAFPVLMRQFRQARRGSTEGDLIVGPAEPGKEWYKLCEAIWPFQFTKEETPLTQELADVLFEGSQGITQYLISLYQAAQVRAINTGVERITPGIISSVADDSFVQATPVLEAMSRGNKETLQRLGDILPPGEMSWLPFVPGDDRAIAPSARFGTARERRIVLSTPSPDEEKNPLTVVKSPVKAKSARKGRPSEGPVSSISVRDEGTLPEIVVLADEEGKSAHTAVMDAGVTGTHLWKEVTGNDGQE